MSRLRPIFLTAVFLTAVMSPLLLAAPQQLQAQSPTEGLIGADSNHRAFSPTLAVRAFGVESADPSSPILSSRSEDIATDCAPAPESASPTPAPIASDGTRHQGPCDDGVWAHDHGQEWDGPGIGVTWCRLTSSHYWCWDLQIVQICQQHCHYGECDITVKF